MIICATYGRNFNVNESLKRTLKKWNIPETGSPVRHFPNMVHPVNGAGPAGKHTSDICTTLRKTTNTVAVVKTKELG